jgi:putative transcriptional regulator
METSLEQGLAQRLRRAREAAGFTQAETAERAGMAVEAYGRLERGAVLPRASTLLMLARTLSISTDELLGNVPESATARPVALEREPAAKRRLIVRVRALDDGAVRVLSAVAAEFARRKLPSKAKRR